VLATLRRAGIGTGTGAGRAGGQSSLGLDLAIVAPSKVFVRGRGIDTELGGEVRLAGPVSAIRPVGALRMRSGRIDILGKRVAFERGELTLVGDLDPNLDFVATSRGDTVSVTVAVYGRASNPQISFTSVPELPQDEVLSQLLFGRGIDQLSPLQIGQLGVAAAELAGSGGGPGILEQLRAGTGLDNLDITSDSEGNIAVEGFTARAEAGQKDSRVGVFYELEY
jgi:translocation and assembly module TamB